MFRHRKFLTAMIFTAMIFIFAAPQIKANDKEYDALVRHLKTKYKAKKVKIPFMFLARAAIKMARPAGVKSFNLTIFEGLNFSPATLDEEMQSAMRNSLGADWSPIIRVRSRGSGAQVYMYMREAGADLKIMLVTIDKENATVIRATFSPEKLAEFINNPRIFGISLDGGKKQSNDEKPTPKENLPAPE
ncbi:MAG: hypothetical protein ACR2GD_01350 [Pyrinomonadaceae bacterium]